MNLLDLPIDVLEHIMRMVLVRDKNIVDSIASCVMVNTSFRFLVRQCGFRNSVAAIVPKLIKTHTKSKPSCADDRLIHRTNRMYGFNFDKLTIAFLRDRKQHYIKFPLLGDRHIKPVRRGIINTYLRDRMNAAIDRIEIEGIFGLFDCAEKIRQLKSQCFVSRQQSPIAIVRARVNKLVGWYRDTAPTTRWRKIYESTIGILTNKSSSIKCYIDCKSKLRVDVPTERLLLELAAIFDKIVGVVIMKQLCLYVASIYVNMSTYTEPRNDIYYPRGDIFEYLLANTPRGKFGVNIIVQPIMQNNYKLSREQLQYSADVLARFILTSDHRDVTALASMVAKASFGHKAAVEYYNAYGTFMSEDIAAMVINTIDRLKRKPTSDERAIRVSAVQYFREHHDDAYNRICELMQKYNSMFGETFRKIVTGKTRGGKRVREKHQRMTIGRTHFNTAYRKYLKHYDIRASVSSIDRAFRTHTIAYLIHAVATT